MISYSFLKSVNVGIILTILNLPIEKYTEISLWKNILYTSLSVVIILLHNLNNINTCKTYYFMILYHK